MKLVALSDTHNRHRFVDEIPGGDVLIHAGDITVNGKTSALKDFIDWFSQFPHEHKIVIAGNHDFCIQNAMDPGTIFEGTGITYLEYDSVIIEGVKFYGCPYSNTFDGYAFSELEEVPIPEDTDVLITHGPPKGELDYVKFTGHVGSKKIKEVANKLDLKAHIFGHIHGTENVSSGKFFNVSLTDEYYRICKEPTVITIDKGLK